MKISNELLLRSMGERGLSPDPDKDYEDPEIKERVKQLNKAYIKYVDLWDELIVTLREKVYD